MLKRISQLLFRSLDEIGLDSYLVLVFCFIGGLLGILGTLINVVLNLGFTTTISTIIASVFFSSVYFYSRIKQKYLFSKYVVILLSLLLLNFQWFSNYGTTGPILYLYVVLEFFVIIFFVKLEKFIFTLIIFINVTTLFLIEYYYPQTIGAYSSNLVRLLDLFFSLLIYMFLSILLFNIAFKYYINQKQKAEQSDKLKSSFLANMSHEIRTPMNGIIGFAELLKDPDLNGKEKEEFLNIIQNSGTRMLSILNDIIDISKIESGLMNLDYKESDIDEQIDFIYTFFKPEVEKKGLEFSINKAALTHETNILVDREKLYAILINLVKNAIKFTREGYIEFGYNKIEMPDKAILEFYVKDSGVGIPRDRQKAIFERFIQADISNKDAYQGAGLGLSISKAFVEMLGGEIWVESEPEKGSSFYFTVPYKVAPGKETAARGAESSPDFKGNVKKLKVLIVDDDKTSVDLLKNIVGKLSSDILIAGNGDKAIEICRNNTDIDLILMDIQLPGVDGYEATRKIRQFNESVIIIAQTAFALTGDREKSIEAGCNDYISKPINKNLLISMIRSNGLN